MVEVHANNLGQTAGNRTHVARRLGELGQGYRPDVVEGRWIIEANYRRRLWEVIVEPDEIDELLVVITAYPVETRS